MPLKVKGNNRCRHSSSNNKQRLLKDKTTRVRQLVERKPPLDSLRQMQLLQVEQKKRRAAQIISLRR